MEQVAKSFEATNDLRTIAQTCLPDGGRAVLDARGLCAVWLKEYYDEGNCASLQSRSATPPPPSEGGKGFNQGSISDDFLSK